MQNIFALLIVALACGYLIRKAWRYFAARKQSVGCGSACGGCAAGGKSLGEAKPLVSIEPLRNHR